LSAPYQLILLGEDEPVARLRLAISKQVESRIGDDVLDIADVLEPVADDPATDAPHRVVVWVGAERAGEALVSLQRAVEAALPILPVVVGSEYELLPGLVEALNAMSLGQGQDEVVAAILRMLGLAEAERRVFISYRRQDTTPLAEQLRHALLDRGFDVFIDRFAIAPGDDVQRRIDIELGDKAFVLVLESPTIRESSWIQHEIDYAVEHRLGLHSLIVPGVTPKQRIVALDDLRRELAADDLVGGELKPQVLEDVCRELEIIHASRLRRHRERMLDALTTWLGEAGFESRSGHDWTVLASRDDDRRVYLITPRAPTATDLYRAHLARAKLSPPPAGIVAHNPRDLDADVVALNTWVADGRDLKTAVLEDLRATLRRS
jgi:hypothetical protein